MISKRSLLHLSFFFTILTCISTSCHLFSSKETPSTPSVNLLKVNLSLTQSGKAKIPVQLSQPSNAPITVEVSLRQITGEALQDFTQGLDYTIEPKTLTFAPGQTTDTLTITNISQKSTPIKAGLFLDKVSSGYRVGVVSFTEINFYGGNSFLLSFTKSTLPLWLDTTPTVGIRTEKGKVKAPFDIPYHMEVDTQKSTALEGVHFSLPPDKAGLIPEGKRAGGFVVKALKYEKGKDLIVLNIVPESGFGIYRSPSITIQMNPTINYSGKWVFHSFENKQDFLDNGERAETIIDGEKGDYVQIEGTPERFTANWHLSSRLKYIFPGLSKAYHLKDFTYRSFQTEGGLPVMNIYMMDNVNTKVSANAQLIRPAQVGFVHVTRKSEEYLCVVVYDMDPIDTFKAMYDILYDPTLEFPMSTWPPLYVFKKEN